MLELVAFNTDYAKEFFELTIKNKQHLRKWLPWLDAINQPQDTLGFLQKTIQDQLNGQALHYFIFYADKLIGTIGLREISKQNATVGYWIDEDYQGKGITTNALKRVIEQAKANNLTDLIILRCNPNNIASSLVAKKCNFSYITRKEKAENLYGIYCDLDEYHLALN